MMKVVMYYTGDRYAKDIACPLIEKKEAKEACDQYVRYLKENFYEIIKNLGESEWIYFTICEKRKNFNQAFYKNKYNYKLLYTGRVYSSSKAIIFDEIKGEFINE